MAVWRCRSPRTASATSLPSKAWSRCSRMRSSSRRQQISEVKEPTIRFGIDLGGTKIEIVALDDEGREVLRRRRTTPKDDYRGTIDAVAGLVRGAENDLGAKG